MAHEQRDVVITGDAEAPGKAACSGAHQGAFAESRLKNTACRFRSRAISNRWLTKAQQWHTPRRSPGRSPQS
jgi:hypothetical protein